MLICADLNHADVKLKWSLICGKLNAARPVSHIRLWLDSGFPHVTYIVYSGWCKQLQNAQILFPLLTASSITRKIYFS